MLAKDIKIKNIMTQRAFIMAQLSEMQKDPREDGNSAYSYVGHIYSENIYFFHMEGFDVTLVESDMLMAATKGIPAYLFTPSDRIELTEEEFQEAEKYQQETEARNKAADAAFAKGIAKFFTSGDDDENSEDEEPEGFGENDED